MTIDTIEKTCGTCAYDHGHCGDCAYDHESVRLGLDEEVISCGLWLGYDPDGGPLDDPCPDCDNNHWYPATPSLAAHNECCLGEEPPQRGYCPGYQQEGTAQDEAVDAGYSAGSGA